MVFAEPIAGGATAATAVPIKISPLKAGRAAARLLIPFSSVDASLKGEAVFGGVPVPLDLSTSILLAQRARGAAGPLECGPNSNAPRRARGARRRRPRPPRLRGGSDPPPRSGSRSSPRSTWIAASQGRPVSGRPAARRHGAIRRLSGEDSSRTDPRPRDADQDGSDASTKEARVSQNVLDSVKAPASELHGWTSLGQRRPFRAPSPGGPRSLTRWTSGIRPSAPTRHYAPRACPPDSGSMPSSGSPTAPQRRASHTAFGGSARSRLGAEPAGRTPCDLPDITLFCGAVPGRQCGPIPVTRSTPGQGQMWRRRGSDVQGGPVDELLDVAVERPAVDQLEVEVGRAWKIGPLRSGR